MLRRPVLLSVLVVATVSAMLQATEIVGADFRQVVSQSTLIVRGHITDVHVSAPPGGPIETVATIVVDATFKGSSDAVVAVRVPGGTAGRIKVITVDAPQLVTGEVAEFFLKLGADGLLRPVGLSLGVYPVAVDPQTQQTAVSPPLVIGLTSAAGPVIHGDPARRLMTTAAFESLVRSVMAAQGRSAPRGER